MFFTLLLLVSFVVAQLNLFKLGKHSIALCMQASADILYISLHCTTTPKH